LENTLKKRIELGILSVLITAVNSFPFHITVFAGGNCSGSGFTHVTHNADSIINKHGWNLMHVVSQLEIRFAGISFLAGRRLEFHDYNRDTVKK